MENLSAWRTCTTTTTTTTTTVKITALPIKKRVLGPRNSWNKNLHPDSARVIATTTTTTHNNDNNKDNNDDDNNDTDKHNHTTNNNIRFFNYCDPNWGYDNCGVHQRREHRYTEARLSNEDPAKSGSESKRI